jgi:hypothetical protein
MYRWSLGRVFRFVSWVILICRLEFVDGVHVEGVRVGSCNHRRRKRNLEKETIFIDFPVRNE